MQGVESRKVAKVVGRSAEMRDLRPLTRCLTLGKFLPLSSFDYFCYRMAQNHHET
jgi:hypothetical protein